MPAFRLGEKTADPLQMYLTDIFTVSANLAGLPGISVPCGFAGDRLPVGLQLTGRMFDEETILRVADAYERATGLAHAEAADLINSGLQASDSGPGAWSLEPSGLEPEARWPAASFEPRLQRVDLRGSVSPSFIGVTDT